MIRRALLHTLLAVSLVLASLTSVVAQTRMAAAGGYCGTGAPALLLDASGLPILDVDGSALAVPDCPACLLALAAPLPARPTASAPRAPLRAQAPFAPQPLTSPLVTLGGQARAPPALV